MQKSIFTLLITLLCAFPLAAQPVDTLASTEKFPYSFTQFGNETWLFAQQPLKWETSDWLTIGAIAAGTYILVETVDERVRTLVTADQKHSKSVPYEAGRMWGDLYTPVLLFSGYAAHSLLTGDPKTRKIGYEIGQASLYAGALTALLKYAIGRARPFVNEGAKTFRPFSALFESEYHSLPGGHTTAAFVLSTVLSRNAEPLWLKILAYVPAALTFISRVYQDKHWMSDDFTGAALGFFVATWVVDQHEASPAAIGMTSITPFSISITF